MDKIIPDKFRKSHSALNFLIILILSVLGTEILIEYLSIYVPVFHFLNMPFMKAVMLIVFLLPVFYFFFYRPMTKQIIKLEKAEVIQRELSLVDILTGLYNRRGFFTYASHLLNLADRTKQQLVLIYADLDNLKSINDHLGHAGGDKAIACVANVLTDSFRDSDVVGRVGGDEFAILAFEVKEENIDVLSQRLNHKLKEAEGKLSPTCPLSISLGIISYNSNQSQTIEDLMKRADTLMYEAKRSRNKIAIDFKNSRND